MTQLTVDHRYTSERAAKGNRNGHPVLVASCRCGWTHMTAFNPVRHESERDANAYLQRRYDEAHGEEDEV